MKEFVKSRNERKSETGVALLIAIFVLLLVSVVAICLIVSSGTETSLGGNYRSSTAAYYAALAGLQEGRGRISSKNPNYLGPLLGGPGPLALGQAIYIENPVAGEDVLAVYPDTEYAAEFSGTAFNPPIVKPTPSVSNQGGIPGPPYRWVRINAVTEASLKLVIDQSSPNDSTTPLYYDGAHLNLHQIGTQVFEVTALAILPSGARANPTQKLLQYIIAPDSVPLNFGGAGGSGFASALTLVGNGVAYTGPGRGSFEVNGDDLSVSGYIPPTPGVSAIGYTNPGDSAMVAAGANPSSNYTSPTGIPSIGQVTMPSNVQTPSGLDQIVQTITQSADVVVTPPSGTGGVSLVPSSMMVPAGQPCPTTPMTMVVQGALDLDGWDHHFTGCGLLVVTGDLNIDPETSWTGIILVIGQGNVTGNRSGNGNFTGAILVAKIRDGSGNLLPDPNVGASSVQFSPGMGGNGIQYSSFWSKAALPVTNYKILAFHEIPQQ